MSHPFSPVVIGLACTLSATVAATVAATPATAQASNNNVLVLDGRGDYLAANSLLKTSNNFTIEAWVNPALPHEIDSESTSGYAGLNGQRFALFPLHGTYCWGKGHAGVGFSVGTNGVSVYEHAGDYMPALLVYRAPIVGWTHIAIVYHDHQPSLFVNGVLVRTGLKSPMAFSHPSAGHTPSHINGHPLELGGIGGGRESFFKGELDDFRVWESPLNESQIRASMSGKLPENGKGLLVNLDMNRTGAGSGLVIDNIALISKQGEGIASSNLATTAITIGTASTPYFAPFPSDVEKFDYAMLNNTVPPPGTDLAGVDSSAKPQTMELTARPDTDRWLPRDAQINVNMGLGMTMGVEFSRGEAWGESSDEAAGISLEQNVPNPFSEKTLIAYRIATSGHVTLQLFDPSGRPLATVIDEQEIAGRHEVVIGADLLPASGNYYYRLTLDKRSLSSGMTVVK